MLRGLYAAFAYLGLMVLPAMFITGFRYDAAAPISNLWFNAGIYAAVRHPMYRAALLYTFASLLIHPNAGQLLFTAMVSASFIAFIPIEERQLLHYRGSEYRDYQRATPYRVLRGVF
jgi:protein-S-isoprenylcysteine O-methyltransferase Ste14